MRTGRLLLFPVVLGGLLLGLVPFQTSAQYQGGDFVNSNEKDLNEGYVVESEEELVEDLRDALKLVSVGVFPPRRVNCLKFKATRQGTEKALDVMKKIIPILPKKYKIVVIGNADKVGPQFSHRGQKGNDYWSAMRAKCVADYITKHYTDAKGRLLMGGQGSKINKRIVTFEILPEGEARRRHAKLIRKFKWK